MTTTIAATKKRWSVFIVLAPQHDELVSDPVDRPVTGVALGLAYLKVLSGVSSLRINDLLARLGSGAPPALLP